MCRVLFPTYVEATLLLHLCHPFFFCHPFYNIAPVFMVSNAAPLSAEEADELARAEAAIAKPGLKSTPWTAEEDAELIRQAACADLTLKAPRKKLNKLGCCTTASS
jgi:hypothetical protein